MSDQEIKLRAIRAVMQSFNEKYSEFLDSVNCQICFTCSDIEKINEKIKSFRARYAVNGTHVVDREMEGRVVCNFNYVNYMDKSKAIRRAEEYCKMLNGEAKHVSS